MVLKTEFGGKGASTRGFDLAAVSRPGLVVWPILSPSSANALVGSQELYRLAHESAQAVLRPSLYERAYRVVSN